MLTPIGFDPFIGETIKEVKFGHPEMPKKGSYEVYTFICNSGKMIVVSSLCNQICFSVEKP